MTRIKHSLFWAALLLLATGPVYAHPLHGGVGGFGGGLLHPLLGIDHLLAMVAVGVWAAQLGGSALWKVPLAFVGTLLIGAWMGLAGIGLPMIEPMLAASIVVLGLVISRRAQMAPWLAGLLVAAFALFHGHAHVSDLSAGVAALSYVAGFTLTTVFLHGVGIAAGYLLQQRMRDSLIRASGIALAGVGVWLLAGIGT